MKRTTRHPDGRKSKLARRRSAADVETDAVIESMDTALRFGFAPSLGAELYAGVGPEKPATVVIDVDSERARLASSYKWHDKQKVQTQRDGAVRLTFTCSDYAPLIAWVMRLGSHAVVIKPPALARAVKEQFRATARLYAGTRKRR